MQSYFSQTQQMYPKIRVHSRSEKTLKKEVITQ
jgi:hypothetical protein